MSWIMKAKILNVDYVSVYAANKKYMKLVNILYKWEVIR
jgi:hypothetical protein|nr:MAG TPA: hypothetical protein [Caudoviricetes sp.]